MFFSRFSKKFIVGEHHRRICEALDRVVAGKCRRLIINIAPRFGKTELAVKSFIAYGLMINPAAKFIHLSYSDSLATDNSDNVREMIKHDAYMLIAPYVDVSKTSDSKKSWKTTAGGGVYATSAGGQITGFGAGEVEEEDDLNIVFDGAFEARPSFSGAIVIDDPLKPEDALMDSARNEVNRRFETTIRNRVNSRNTPIIIIMQRLHEQDLCGYLQRVEPDEWEVLSLPAISTNIETGNDFALWGHKMTVKELRKLEEISPMVFQTQYMQNPTPIEGLLYRPFKTYAGEPPRDVYMKTLAFCDSADTGSDYLAGLVVEERTTGGYVVDILHSQKPAEVTEPQWADMLAKHKVDECLTEANSAGRAFSRNVERISRTAGNVITYFRTFTQTKKKEVRIFTNANEVNNWLIFPEGWDVFWPSAYNELTSRRKDGKHKNDDFVDVCTMATEHRKYEPYRDNHELITKRDLGLL
jgi:predicted phage terminase large subunit-like protein